MNIDLDSIQGPLEEKWKRLWRKSCALVTFKAQIHIDSEKFNTEEERRKLNIPLVEESINNYIKEIEERLNKIEEEIDDE